MEARRPEKSSKTSALSLACHYRTVIIAFREFHSRGHIRPEGRSPADLGMAVELQRESGTESEREPRGVRVSGRETLCCRVPVRSSEQESQVDEIGSSQSE